MTRRRSRAAAVPTIVLLATALVSTASPAGDQAPDATAILKAARDAMGGDARIRGLRSLRMTGTEFATQAVFGGYTQDTEVPYELRMAFPDQFVEVSVLPWPDRPERLLGFDGDRTISTLAGEPSGSDPAARATYARKAAAERLLLILARTETWGGLTFEAAGPTTLQVRGLDDYAARLEFSPESHLLTTLTYRERRQVRPRNTIRFRDANRPARRSSGSGGGSGGSGGERPEIDITVTLHDRRKVDGLLLPSRITTTAEDTLLWELRFTEIAIDPRLTAADFGGE
jgi:hypothetical protein